MSNGQGVSVARDPSRKPKPTISERPPSGGGKATNKVFTIEFDEQRNKVTLRPEGDWDWELEEEITFRCNVPLEAVVLRPSLTNLFQPDDLIPAPPTPNVANEFVLKLPALDAKEIDEALMQHNEEFICWFRIDIYFKGQPAATAVLSRKIGHLRPGTRSVESGPPESGVGKGILEDSLDPHGEATEKFLSNVQCNVIKSHGREFSRLLMVRFMDSSIDVRRRWLSQIAGDIVTTALEQRALTERWRHFRERGVRVDGGAMASIALSAKGYAALGLPAGASHRSASARAGSGDNRYTAVPDDMEFLAGMKQADSEYGARWDVSLKDWEHGYRGSDIHFCILLFDDNEWRLGERALHLKRRIAEVGEVVADELGKRRIHKGLKEGELIEHFGFRDGISNPRFLKGEVEPGVFWPSGTEPLKAVFVEEAPLPGVRQEASYGSYLAFLKMEQNVNKFKHETEGLAAALGSGSGNTVCPARAGALAVGRAADGRPLAKVGRDNNDFNYDSSHCPRHSHVRRMNPRKAGDLGMVRRSMHYGLERRDLLPGSEELPPDREVGLLFVSYQSEIQRFSSRMAAANRPVMGGVDSVIGAKRVDRGPGRDGTQTWPADKGDIQFLMADFVKLRGGEYFFCPSISFFAGLPVASL